MKFQNLMLGQLDEQFKKWDAVKYEIIPHKGWVNLIRSALSISSYTLAKRMGVSQTRIMQIEQAEFKRVITLNTLEQAAEAMGCKLVYSIVPKTTLKGFIQDQALKFARKNVKRVAHSMALEDQALDDIQDEKQAKELADELLNGDIKRIWGE